MAVITVAALLLGFAAFPRAEAALPVATWSAPVDLSRPKDDGRDTQVFMSDDGSKITAVWWERDYSKKLYSVWSASSSDGGATWPTYRQVSPGTKSEAYLPVIDGSADGSRLTVAWYASDGSNLRVHSSSSTDAGATWGPEQLLSAAGRDAQLPRVAVDGTGQKAAVVWRRNSGKGFVIQAAASTDGGSTWSTPATLSQDGAKDYFPQVAMSANGKRLTAVWHRTDRAGTQVQASTSADGGASWSPAVALSGPGGSGQNPQVAQSDGGKRIVVVWEGLSTNGYSVVVGARSNDRGASWSPISALSEDGADSFAPQIAGSARARSLMVVWSRSDGDNIRVQSSRSGDRGASWSPPATLSNAEDDSFTPQIAVSDNARKGVAVWLRHAITGEYTRIQSAATGDGGRNWTQAVDLSGLVPDPMVAVIPDVVMSADGLTVAAGWHRDNPKSTGNVDYDKTEQTQIASGRLASGVTQ
jgi:hypothetical protein